jgi:hypothetical protein
MTQGYRGAGVEHKQEINMRVAPDNEADDRDDFDDCPFCRATIIELAEDVCDSDCSSEDPNKDVAAIKCPSCNQSIALVRTHSYRLAKFRAPV